jgi:hypothetical protein
VRATFGLSVVAFDFVTEALAAGFAGASTVATAPAEAVSARVVFERATRALPAAVWAPFALPALAAAMRALAAFAAAALPVVFEARAAVWTWAPPRAALIFRARRAFRRAAAFRWMAPTLAARSRALIASARAASGSAPSGWVVATAMAFLTSVLAAVRRGARISWRRSEARTRLRPDGVRAPVHLRGVFATVGRNLWCGADLVRRGERDGEW